MSTTYPQVGNLKNLYSFTNLTIASGSNTGSTLDVSPYTRKQYYAYIGTTQNASGSLVISGSPDGTTFFQYSSGTFNSGSMYVTGSTDLMQTVQVSLRNLTTAAISGSIYVLGFAGSS